MLYGTWCIPIEKVDLELLNLDWREVGLWLVRVSLWVLHSLVTLPLSEAGLGYFYLCMGSSGDYLVITGLLFKALLL